jgi:hypothetical protein
LAASLDPVSNLGPLRLSPIRHPNRRIGDSQDSLGRREWIRAITGDDHRDRLRDQRGKTMAYKRIRIEPDDTEGHGFKFKEDLTGQAVTVRMEDGTEVEGHVFRREDLTGEDTKGHGLKRGIDLEVDDTQAHLLAAVNERGEPVYVRFPDDDDVRGHLWRIK